MYSEVAPGFAGGEISAEATGQRIPKPDVEDKNICERELDEAWQKFRQKLWASELENMMWNTKNIRQRLPLSFVCPSHAEIHW